MDNHNKNSRREFIKSLVRKTTLVGIVAGGAFLVTKEKSEKVCDLDFICSSCKKNKYCSLPEASKFRVQKRKLKDG